VTNGPLVRFTVAGAGPGDVVKQTGDVPFELAIASALPFERAEVLVNGEVVWEADGRAKPGPSTHRGILSVPAGGWIAARVHGGEMAWPGMDSYPFAHTSARAAAPTRPPPRAPRRTCSPRSPSPSSAFGSRTATRQRQSCSAGWPRRERGWRHSWGRAERRYRSTSD
jgi:hypothetical protein